MIRDKWSQLAGNTTVYSICFICKINYGNLDETLFGSHLLAEKLVHQKKIRLDNFANFSYLSVAMYRFQIDFDICVSENINIQFALLLSYITVLCVHSVKNELPFTAL